jgi:hypothetical protein
MANVVEQFDSLLSKTRSLMDEIAKMKIMVDALPDNARVPFAMQQAVLETVKAAGVQVPEKKLEPVPVQTGMCSGFTKKNAPCRGHCVKGKTLCWAHLALVSDPSLCQQVPAPASVPVPVLAPGEKPKRKLNISAKGMEAKIAAGKKLAALNAARKEFIENAKMEGEW